MKVVTELSIMCMGKIIVLRVVDESDINIKQDNDPKRTSRCRQTVTQSRLIPSWPTLIFNHFGNNFS